MCVWIAGLYGLIGGGHVISCFLDFIGLDFLSNEVGVELGL